MNKSTTNPPLGRCISLAVGAIVLLVPANVLPVMHMAIAGGPASDTTIFSGVALLCQDGLWGLAAIVFTASILVPFLKLGGLAWLVLHVHTGDLDQAPRLTRSYDTLDFIGRWSMLDVFLVAFLSGAVRFGRLANVEPRMGILAFAGAVILTMLATQAFDPRWLWQNETSTDPN